MRKIDIAEMLGSDAIAADIRKTVRYAIDTRGTKVRLVYVPHEVMVVACQKAAQLTGMQPFTPTIYGIPCQFSANNEVSVGCVADDNTNFERTTQREVEVLH